MKQKLLLVGDSIRISYQPHVAAEVGDTIEVLGTEANCLDTAKTLQMFDDYLVAFNPTVVHWNNGLHDIKRLPDADDCQVPIDDYRRNLQTLAERFRTLTGGKVIWATTTPVFEEKHNAVKGFRRYNHDIDAYNQVARRVMSDAGIIINDLHAVIAADPENFIVDDGVHLNDVGQHAAARAVVDVVRSIL